MAEPNLASVTDAVPLDQLRSMVRHEPRRESTASELEATADMCERLIRDREGLR